MSAKTLPSGMGWAHRGKPPRLTDPGPAAEIRELVERAKSDPVFAKQWLIDRGFVTPTGKTPKKFGGGR